MYEEKKYSKVLKLYIDEEPESEAELLTLSLSISGLEKQLNNPKTKKETESVLSSFKKIQIVDWQNSNNSTYFHLEDPYFPLLKKHSLAYKRALGGKILAMEKAIPSVKANYYLLLLLVEDPRGNESQFGDAFANLLSKSLQPIGEIEREFLLQDLEYLSSVPKNVFYENSFRIFGTSINLRSGPGKENPEISQGNTGDQAFCFASDLREETINGISGVWRQCYFSDQGKSAWVFSGFLKKDEPSLDRIQSLNTRFKEIENEIKIDFEGWSGDRIPITFHGKYIPRKRKVVSGEAGFPLYSSRNGKYERICKKFSGEKNYFEFSFFPTASKEPIPLFEIDLVYAGSSHPAYSISADSMSVLVNKNRTVLEEELKRRENLSLHIESRDGSKLVGSLWRRNTGLLQSLKSFPLNETILSSGKYSWEICLLLAQQPDKHELDLFEIRTGVH